jgi:hypothetical protein
MQQSAAYSGFYLACLGPAAVGQAAARSPVQRGIHLQIENRTLMFGTYSSSNGASGFAAAGSHVLRLTNLIFKFQAAHLVSWLRTLHQKHLQL